jgi:NDP-sugar pyrophosphorylase family protein
VLDKIGCKTGDIIVSYGDVFTEIDVNELIKYHNKCKSKMNVASTLSVFQVPEEDINRLGIAEIEERDGLFLVRKFIEKPDPKDVQSNWANACYYVLDLDALYNTISGEKAKIENYLFPQLAENGKLAAFKTKTDFWIDIGTKDAYFEANRLAHDHLIIPPPLLKK